MMPHLIRYPRNRSLFPIPLTLCRFLVEDAFGDHRWDLFFVPASRPLKRLTGLAFGLPVECFPGPDLAVDLYEDDDRLVLKAHLPGTREGDVEITEQNGFLTIRARRAVDLERKRAGWQLRVQRRGAWQCSLPLPMRVDVHRSQAWLKDGVLTVFLPRRDTRKNLIQQIRLKAAGLNLPEFTQKPWKVNISRN